MKFNIEATDVAIIITDLQDQRLILQVGAIIITDLQDETLISFVADNYQLTLDLVKLVTETGSLVELMQRIEGELRKSVGA